MTLPGAERSESVIRAMLVAALVFAATVGSPAAEELKVTIGYLGRAKKIETISLLDQPAALRIGDFDSCRRSGCCSEPLDLAMRARGKRSIRRGLED